MQRAPRKPAAWSALLFALAVLGPGCISFFEAETCTRGLPPLSLLIANHAETPVTGVVHVRYVSAGELQLNETHAFSVQPERYDNDFVSGALTGAGTLTLVAVLSDGRNATHQIDAWEPGVDENELQIRIYPATIEFHDFCASASI